ncbi:MAG: TAXI family TRAP transporter solute-binding subunit [Candidatus Thiodiazotropha sp. (ex Lucina aurantia)]|uniref:NMT1/THI5 like protein n=1 Tax=Candidatus Thiodiazotropha endolucinida TaxID=1655433 RepID=A0A7Z0VMZ8_9GAMM|nr:TAXI family TRAP transporter solute-binding subunit [Candidatus Thiodiazotropha endolucinida]MBT3014779.1 TAXI family TRAP transporter solute-binding subunit [Candidatus Thiodiazotropha taylori]MBT3031514.1 TAXI family TRAP transporter solute-binding subunit [Candidatus Thiodiazotropha sp. (ex Lucina pensylvanica)]MBT3039672.1 TAXI family TRAP transporter solute-binding subunit [Candidatus Thiodiazotropha sp. (ex Codakia orbicularis)]MBV2103744.1 TAXI family TRAP transporter solute-binding s
MNKLIALCLLLAPMFGIAAEQRFTSIGTGGLTGVYYPTGGAICRLLNKGRKSHGIRCSVESTGGSIFNLNTIASGELDFGVAQSDWQYHAFNGSSKFSQQGPNKSLRAVFSIHSEPFTVMARNDSHIRVFTDLKGKRVNIGNPGSGQRGTMEVLMNEYNWNKGDFKLASELKATEQARALCDNKIDAMIYTVGHPNASIKEAATACDTHLVPVSGEVVNALIATNPYYASAVIPAGMYRGSDSETATFGVKATLVTSETVDEAVVYQLVKAVFENLAVFRKLHPAFSHLQAEEMLKGNSAPFHAGALRYYKEKGLL